MKNSADTDVARLHYNNLRDGEILIWTPCPCDPVYFQHPMNFHMNLSTRSPNNTRHPEQSYSLPRSINEIYISVWEGNEKIMVELKWLHFTVPLNSIHFSSGWSWLGGLLEWFLNKSLSRCVWEASTLCYDICMRHGEREKTQESRLSCQSWSTSVCRLNGLVARLHPQSTGTTARCLLYRLQTSHNQQGGWGPERGKGVVSV